MITKPVDNGNQVQDSTLNVEKCNISSAGSEQEQASNKGLNWRFNLWNRNTIKPAKPQTSLVIVSTKTSSTGTASLLFSSNDVPLNKPLDDDAQDLLPPTFTIDEVQLGLKHTLIPIKTQPVQQKAILTNKTTDGKHSNCRKLPLTATTVTKKARKEANLLDKNVEAANLHKTNQVIEDLLFDPGLEAVELPYFPPQTTVKMVPQSHTSLFLEVVTAKVHAP